MDGLDEVHEPDGARSHDLDLMPLRGVCHGGARHDLGLAISRARLGPALR